MTKTAFDFSKCKTWDDVYDEIIVKKSCSKMEFILLQLLYTVIV